jgi:hypothetical protein
MIPPLASLLTAFWPCFWRSILKMTGTALKNIRIEAHSSFQSEFQPWLCYHPYANNMESVRTASLTGKDVTNDTFFYQTWLWHSLVEVTSKLCSYVWKVGTDLSTHARIIIEHNFCNMIFFGPSFFTVCTAPVESTDAMSAVSEFKTNSVRWPENRSWGV